MKCVDENQGEFYGQESWGLMEIQSIDAPNSFTAKDFFADADGNINQEMSPQTLTVELVEENGKTRMIDCSVTETAEQLEEFIKMGMIEGFASQLNKLEALLAE